MTRRSAPKRVTLWVVMRSEGDFPCTWSFSLSRRNAMNNFIAGLAERNKAHPWVYWYRRGYRCVPGRFVREG